MPTAPILRYINHSAFITKQLAQLQLGKSPEEVAHLIIRRFKPELAKLIEHRTAILEQDQAAEATIARRKVSYPPD